MKLDVPAMVLDLPLRLSEAIALESEALRLKREHFPLGNVSLLASIENLSTCYEKSNRQSEAQVLRSEMVALQAKAKFSNPEPEQNPADSLEP